MASSSADTTFNKKQVDRILGSKEFFAIGFYGLCSSSMLFLNKVRVLAIDHHA